MDSPYRRASCVCTTIYFNVYIRIATGLSVCSAARMKHLENQWTNYHEVWRNVLLKCHYLHCDIHMPGRMSSVIRQSFYKYWAKWQIHTFYSSSPTHQNSIQEEIKSRLKLGNACYHSVQNLLSSSLLSKNVKIKIYRTVILPVVLYGCETWSLTLREEHRLKLFENRVLPYYSLSSNPKKP